MNPSVEFGLEIAVMTLCIWFVVAIWPEHLCPHRGCPHIPRKGGRK